MANMSYCRFRNTANDLEDCLNAIDDNESLSDEEVRAAKGMFHQFLEFMENYGIIDEYDSEELNSLIDDLGNY